MSRVGNSAITIPSDVTLSQQDGRVIVKGKNGELSAQLHSEVELNITENIATLKPKRKTKLSQSLWGTMRASINNMVVGVHSVLPASWKSTVLAIGHQCRVIR